MKSKDSGSYNGANRPVCFRNEETDTTVECGYDSQGRRYFKKVTVSGTVTLHHRYLYRGYLQIACVDCTRSGHPALWLVTWDPSQATATRPLAIQKDGTWFTYGYDLTKNICEVFGPAGYIRTAYSYAPFGNVTESGDVSQPFQWSSEHYDSELDLVYYNYRHYSPSLGRFLSRDPIAEQGGRNLYAFVQNNPILLTDEKGESWSSLAPPGLCIYAGTVFDYLSQCTICPVGSKTRQGKFDAKEYRTTTQYGNPKANGCGPAGWKSLIIPDKIVFVPRIGWISFTPACDIHDICYGTCGSSKSDCDFALRLNAISICQRIPQTFKGEREACFSAAENFFLAVSKAGGSAFDVAQDEHCKWAPCFD